MGRLGRVERAESQTVLPLRWLVLGRKEEKEGEEEKRRERKKERRKKGKEGREGSRKHKKSWIKIGVLTDETSQAHLTRWLNN